MIDRRRLLPLALLLGVAIAACGRSEPEKARSEAAWRDAKQTAAKAAEEVKQKTKEAGETTKQIVEDTAVTAKVRTALLAEKDVKSADIAVETFQGNVILRGTVPDRSQVELAGKVAQSVDGAKAVDNRLTVK